MSSTRMVGHLPVPVVRATLDDLDVVAPLFDAYRVFYRRPSDPATARAFVQARLEQQESVVFIARDGTTRAVLGFVQLYPSFSSVAARRIWILNDLYVVPDARKRGVARSLMACARAFGVAGGALRLALETAEDNQPARTLYESLGYVREGGVCHYSLDLEP